MSLQKSKSLILTQDNWAEWFAQTKNLLRSKGLFHDHLVGDQAVDVLTRFPGDAGADASIATACSKWTADDQRCVGYLLANASATSKISVLKTTYLLGPYGIS